ncbi:MAG: hypothetical protein IIA90_03670, partial [Chloroflexi bacterium]|nr:hypothetical protein [Chloroflexota bacterium]
MEQDANSGDGGGLSSQIEAARREVLRRVYEVYALYDEERRGLFAAELEAACKENHAGIAVVNAILDLMHDGLLFVTEKDWIGINYAHVEDVEEELAASGNNFALKALETRRRILDSYRQADVDNRLLPVSQVVQEMELRP